MSHCDKYSDGDLCHEGHPCVLVDSVIYLLLNNLNGIFFFFKVWEGLNVIKIGRLMLGETNPFDSKPGTIRGDFCVQVGR